MVIGMTHSGPSTVTAIKVPSTGLISEIVIRVSPSKGNLTISTQLQEKCPYSSVEAKRAPHMALNNQFDKLEGQSCVPQC